MDYNKIRKIINDLKNDNVFISDLQIVNEIDCRLNENISDELYDTLFNSIKDAYYSTEELSLETIARCAINNIHKLNDEEFDLINESCYLW